MPKYEIDVPGQGKFEVDSPTDLTDAQAYAAVQAQLKGAAPAEPTQDTGLLSMTGRAIARGAKQTGSLIGDILPAMAAKAVGADEYAARQMEEAAQTQREIEQKYGARYKSLEDVKGIGDYIPFALETVAEQIPGMATALIPGAGLGVAGGRMAATAAAKKLAEREATEAGARYAAMKTAQGVGRGQIGGTFLGSYALNAPEVFQNIYEETGQMEPAAAALAGSVSAALDSILPVAILRQMGPNVKAGVVENLLEKSGMPSQLARKVVSSAVTGAGTEGLTEGAQEAISIAAEKFVQENPEVWGSKEFNRLVESSVRGAVGGGAFGAAGAGAGAYLEGRRGRLEQKQLEADRREIVIGDLTDKLGREPTEEEVATTLKAMDAARKEMEDEGRTDDTGAAKRGISTSEQGEAELGDAAARTAAAQQKRLAGDTGTTTSTADREKLQPGALEAEANKIADEVESLGEKGFADGMRSRIKAGGIKTSADLDFYRQRLTQYQQQAGEAGKPVSETYNTRSFIGNYKADKARFESFLPTAPQPVQDMIAKADQYIQSLADKINAAGYKVLDVNTASPQEVQVLKDKISQLGGTSFRYLKDADHIAKKNRFANPATFAKDEQRLNTLFTEADQLLAAPTPAKKVTPAKQLNAPTTNVAGYTPKRINDILSTYAYGTRDEDVNKTKAYVGYVSPEDFLNATTQSPEGLKYLETDKRAKPLNVQELAEEIQNIHLTLDENFNLIGHEGRHRMIALRNAGVKKVPVIFDFYRGENRFERQDQYIPPQKFNQGGRGQKGFYTDLVPVTYVNEERLKAIFGQREGVEGQVLFAKSTSPKADKVPLNDPLFKTAHPTVTTAIANNDVQGALRALKSTAGKFLSGLADRLMQLNLNTVVGFDDLHYDLSIKGLDRVSGQKARLMAWLQQVRPDIYRARFDESKMRMPVTELLRAFEEFRDGKLGIDPSMFKEDLDDLIKVYENALRSLNAPGTFFMEDNAIGLSLANGGNSNYAISHELTHAATHWAIENSDKLDDKQRKALANLYRLFRYAKKHTKDQSAYGYNNLHEFVAEAFSRPSFQNELRQMKKVMDTNMSAWSKFIQLVAQLFGMDNVLFHTLANADVLFSANSGGTTNKGPELLWAPSRYNVSEGNFKLNMAERMSWINRLIKDSRTPWEKTNKGRLKSFLGSLSNQYRRYLLGAFTVDQLADIYGADMPQLKEYVREVDNMIATRNAILKEMDPVAAKWADLLDKNPKKAEQLGKAMIEATLKKLDPDPKGTGHDATKVQADPSLKKAWFDLTSGPDGDVAVEIYRQVRAFYERRMNEYIKVQLARIEEAGKAKGLTAEELQAKKLAFQKDIEEKIIRPYFPIKRFGDYFLMVGKGKKKIFMQFEDAYARDAELEKQRERLIKSGMTEEEAASELWPGQGFNEVLNQKLSEVTQLNKIKEMVDQTTEDILKSTDPSIVQDRVTGLQEALKDQFGQYYLELLPSESIKKMFLHRENVAGPSQDMLRAFNVSRARIAYQRARFQHMPQLFLIVEAARMRLKSMPTTEEKAVYGDVANELAKQFSGGVLEPPKQSKLATFLTHFGFLNFLTAPASAIVNTMAIPGIYIPVAASQYGGYSRVGSVISKYMRMLGGTGYVNEETGRYEFLSLARANLADKTDLKDKDGKVINLPKGKTFADVYTAGVNSGSINTTLVHDSISMGEQPSEDYTGRWQKFMYYASLPFHAAEKFNREIAYLTSFELAYEKNISSGMTPEAAYDAAVIQARDLTQKTMFNYNSTNKPRYFRGNIPSVLLQFKMYPQHMCVLMFRTFYKAFKDGEAAEMAKLEAQYKNAPPGELEQAKAAKKAELAEIKSEARKAFFGLMGMSFLTAGITGMPLWFIFSGVASAFHAAFEDDDEPFDADNWFKNWANRNFGGFAGDTISRGLLSQVTGMNFADRMNLNLPDMWFPDVRKSQSEVDYVQNMFINTLGPSMGALLVSYPEALKRFNDGHTERAIEALMPAAIKNVMVGTRYMTEGQALTLKGNTLVEDISAREALSQMLGFSPERVAQKQQAAFAMKNVNETIMNRRTDLLNAFFIAVDTGDSDMLEKVIDKIIAFSQTNPGVAIDPKKLVTSVSKRYKDRALANITGGMNVNKNLIPQLVDMLEYGEE